MSETFDGKKNERGLALLSLASWMEPEEGERQPEHADASKTRRARRTGEPDAPSGQPGMSPLLAGLAQGAQPETPPARTAPDTTRPEPSAPSIADLLRRRSRELARQPDAPPVEDAAPPGPEILPPPRAELPRSRRLNLPRHDREPDFRPPGPKPETNARPSRPDRKAGEKPRRANEPPLAGDVAAGAKSRESGHGGIVGAIAKLVGRRKTKAGAADDAPPPLRRSPPARALGRSPEPSPSADTGNRVPTGEGHTKGSSKKSSARGSLMSVIRRASAGPEASVAKAEHPAPLPPAPQPAAHSNHPPALHNSPAPMHSAPMPMTAPAAPVWPAAMPMPPLPSFYPAAPAPMGPPASAHFYWPQPVMPQHWAYAAPHVPPGWQAPALPPAAPLAHTSPAPANSAWPGAANDAASYPMHPAHPYAADADPLISEIDEVRERLRLFGQTLRELHRTRASRQLG